MVNYYQQRRDNLEERWRKAYRLWIRNSEAIGKITMLQQLLDIPEDNDLEIIMDTLIFQHAALGQELDDLVGKMYKGGLL